MLRYAKWEDCFDNYQLCPVPFKSQKKSVFITVWVNDNYFDDMLAALAGLKWFYIKSGAKEIYKL